MSGTVEQNGVASAGNLAPVEQQLAESQQQQMAEPQQQQLARPQQVPVTMNLGYNAYGTTTFKPKRCSSPLSGTFSSLKISSPSVVSQQKNEGCPKRYGPNSAMALSPNGTTLSPTSEALPAHVLMPPPSQPVHVLMPPPSQTASKTYPTRLASFRHSTKFRGSKVIGMMAHVLQVFPGEDLSSKISSCSLNDSNMICILSANGYISHVTLKDPSQNAGTVTHEGRFQIIFLKGSFQMKDVGGQRITNGELTVMLVGQGGQSLIGPVAGPLVAASPVTVVVGTFPVNGCKEPKPTNKVDADPAPPTASPGGAPEASIEASAGTSTEAVGDPLDAASGSCPSDNGKGMSSSTP